MTSWTRYTQRALVASALAFGIAVSLHVPGEAHKAITSKYHFNEDLFPLFRDHCGRCHIDGGVAPMSLLTYEDASPWAESLRLEFLSEDPPPPWHQMKLTPRELDMMLVWANGGTPRGDVEKAPPAVPLVNAWVAGPPDVSLPLPAPFTLDGPVNEATHDVTLPLAPAAGRGDRRHRPAAGEPRHRAQRHALAQDGRRRNAAARRVDAGRHVRGGAGGPIEGARRRLAGCPHRIPAHLEVRGPGADRHEHDRPLRGKAGGKGAVASGHATRSGRGASAAPVARGAQAPRDVGLGLSG